VPRKGPFFGERLVVVARGVQHHGNAALDMAVRVCSTASWRRFEAQGFHAAYQPALPVADGGERFGELPAVSEAASINRIVCGE
jgi:hypothetical protein